MFKKICVIGVIVFIMALAFVPVWSTRMADMAFDNPKEAWAQDSLKKAIQLKMYSFMFTNAREVAEKAVIIFPESKNLDYYIYSAGLCATKERKDDVAIIWFDRFVKVFPDHQWTNQAQAKLTKLKALNDEM